MVALTILTVGASASVAPRRLSLSEALARAYAHNPEIRSAEIQLEQAREMDAAAGGFYWKALSVNIGVMPPLEGLKPQAGGTWTDGGGFVVNFNLGDLLVDGPQGKRTADLQVKLAQEALRRARLEVAAQVAAADAAYQASEQIETLSEQSERAANLDRQDAEQEFASGHTTGIELRKAQLTWRQAEVNLAGARSDVFKTWAALMAAIGDSDALSNQEPSK